MSFSAMMPNIMVDVVCQAITTDVDQEDFTEFAAALADDAAAEPSVIEQFVQTAAEIAVQLGAPPEAVGLTADEIPAAEAVQESAADEKPPQRAAFTAGRKELAEAVRLAADNCMNRSPRTWPKMIRLSVNGWVRLDAFDGEQSSRLYLDWDRSGDA